jgi:TonB family protein
MKRVVLICAAWLVFGGGVANAGETLQTVKALYAAAAYEDALTALNSVEVDGRLTEVHQYRVFCLVALGRNGEAERAMEALITADPLYVFDPVETSPRVQEAFNRRRQQLLPDIAKRFYFDARGALDRKDRAGAIAGFERLLTIIDAAQEAPASLTDLRVLAAGFLDLSRALPAAAPAPPAPAPAAPSSAAATPSSNVETRPVAAVVETPPVALKQDLPTWTPTDSTSRRTAFSGVIRVHVGPDGRVASAVMVRGVHPLYDTALLKAARGWMYEPARRNGVPVGIDISIDVNLRPPQ